MCGIAGFISPTRDQSDLHTLAFTQHHRGPDANGFFHDPSTNVGLCHNRLSILDLSTHANQPMFSTDENFVCVFNGEIYNFKELRYKCDYNFKTESDTEVIIALYTQYGAEMLSMLNGMFAIAIWDKSKQELFICRDRLGIKPLFYYQKDDDFVFSSELKGIKSIVKDLAINTSAIGDYLHLGYIPEPNTIYQNTHKFPTGSYAIFSKGKLDFKKYWLPTIEKKVVDNEKEAITQLDELINRSVKRRMISDVALGVFLSGGVDSSTVAAIANKHSTQPLKTFSIGFEEAVKNEAPFAKNIADHLNTNHHEFIVSQNLVKEQITSIAQNFDEPYADSSAYPTMIVSELARKEVTVALAGDGGDELFHGYGAYNWATRLSKKHVRLGSSTISFLLSLGDDRKKRAAKVFQYGDYSKINSHIFSQEQYLFSAKEINQLVQRDFKPKYNLPDSQRVLTPAEKQAFFDLNYYLKDDLLTKVDRSSMRHSLEARVPLLDHEVVEYALNISPDLKIKNGEQKYILKQLLYSYIPQELFDRPKAGFSIPLNTWLKNDLSYLIDEFVVNGNLDELGIDMNVASRYVDEFRKGRDYYYNRIWLLVVLGMWYNNEK